LTAIQLNLKIRAGFGAIAQLGERNTGSVEVCGSIPHSSTNLLICFDYKQIIFNAGYFKYELVQGEK
jgi:hypothetical protein